MGCRQTAQQMQSSLQAITTGGGPPRLRPQFRSSMWPRRSPADCPSPSPRPPQEAHTILRLYGRVKNLPHPSAGHRYSAVTPSELHRHTVDVLRFRPNEPSVHAATSIHGATKRGGGRHELPKRKGEVQATDNGQISYLFAATTASDSDHRQRNHPKNLSTFESHHTGEGAHRRFWPL